MRPSMSSPPCGPTCGRSSSSTRCAGTRVRTSRLEVDGLARREMTTRGKEENMWWEQSWTTVQQEFSDLGDASDITRICVRLLVALALGALLGYERESVGASAGLRTH